MPTELLASSELLARCDCSRARRPVIVLAVLAVVVVGDEGEL